MTVTARWIEALTGSLEHERQYRQHRARVDALPAPYAAVARAFERYFTYYGGITDGDTLLTRLGDLDDLWERAAVDGMPVRRIVGDVER